MRVKFKYKNHKGLVEDRDVDVVTVGFNFENHPEYGYQPSWCFSGWDYSRERTGEDYRSFYFSNIIIDDKRGTFELFALMRDEQLDPTESARDILERWKNASPPLIAVQLKGTKHLGQLDGTGTTEIGGRLVGVNWNDGTRTTVSIYELIPITAEP